MPVIWAFLKIKKERTPAIKTLAIVPTNEETIFFEKPVIKTSVKKSLPPIKKPITRGGFSPFFKNGIAKKMNKKRFTIIERKTLKNLFPTTKKRSARKQKSIKKKRFCL